MARALQTAVANFEEHMQGREFPACFSAEEYNAWLLHETEVNTKPLRAFVCRDCTPAFKIQMRKENRCCQVTVDISKIVD